MDHLPRTAHETVVTPDNFNRAETDMYFRWTVRLEVLSGRWVFATRNAGREGPAARVSPATTPVETRSAAEQYVRA